MENTTKDPTGGAQEEKTFTQDDVNRIVQERLHKEREKLTKDIEEREIKIKQRETKAEIKEHTAKTFGSAFDDEILDYIGGDSVEDFNERHKKLIGVIEKLGYSKMDEPKEPTSSKESETGKKFPTFTAGPSFVAKDTPPDLIGAAFKYPGKE